MINPCVYATSAHTNYAGNLLFALQNVDYSLESKGLTALKIRVSLVRFRDWPPGCTKTPCLTARRFVFSVGGLQWDRSGFERSVVRRLKNGFALLVPSLIQVVGDEDAE